MRHPILCVLSGSEIVSPRHQSAHGAIAPDHVHNRAELIMNDVNKEKTNKYIPVIPGKQTKRNIIANANEFLIHRTRDSLLFHISSVQLAMTSGNLSSHKTCVDDIR